MPQAEPKLPDDDGGDDDSGDEELNVEVAPNDNEVCTWTDDPDEKRRAFVIHHMVDGDIDGKTMVKNMHAVYEWLKNGTLPIETERPGKPKIMKVSE